MKPEHVNWAEIAAKQIREAPENAHPLEGSEIEPWVEPISTLTRKEQRDLEFERLYVQRDHMQALGMPYATIKPILRRIQELNQDELAEMGY